MTADHNVRAPFRIVVRHFSRGDIGARWDLFSLRISCTWPVRTGTFVRYYWHFESTVAEILRPDRWRMWGVLPRR